MCNQQRRLFVKSAWYHAGLKSRLQLENQADSGPTPLSRLHSRQPKSQTRTVDSDAESSLSPASPPVVSDIAGYNLVKDKITYVWDVQRHGQAIKAEKERKKRLAIEAGLASLASSSLKIC